MLPSGVCDVPDDVCCTTNFDVANHLLVNVYDALASCYSEGPCASPPLLAYISHGQGDDGVTDSLMVSIQRVEPSPGSYDAAGRQTGYTLYRSTFRVLLRESGWPMARAEGGDIHAPEPVRQNALARHSYAHGEMMYRKLNSMRYSRSLVPASHDQPSVAAFGALIPLPPLGGTVGWFVDIALDMIWR